MTSIPTRRLTATAAALLLAGLAGCSNMPTLSGRRVTVGTLKSHVARLETENDQLRRELADKEAERGRLETELSQAESSNGELTARLDDARQALRSQGGDPEALATPSRSPSARARTAPASDPRRPGRRRPFAEIPGRITDAEPSSPDADTDADPPPDRTSRWQPPLAPERALR